MPIFVYDCYDCKNWVKIFSNKAAVCPKCGSDRIKRVRSTPLQGRNMSGKDYYGINYREGVKEDVKERNRRHTNETMKETIAKFGKKIAKEQKWLNENGKARTDWEDK